MEDGKRTKTMKNSILSKTLEQMKAKGLYNNIKTVESEQGAYLKINGKKY